MANYFYIDARGTKQGPVSEQQVEELVAQGTIRPMTSIETEDGREQLAGQIPGLFVQRSQKASMSSLGLSIPCQFDFESLSWYCKAYCVLVSILAGLFGVAVTYFGFHAIGQAFSIPSIVPGRDTVVMNVTFYAVVGIAFTWVWCLLGVVITALTCAWCLITARAAQLYVENYEKK